MVFVTYIVPVFVTMGIIWKSECLTLLNLDKQTSFIIFISLKMLHTCKCVGTTMCIMSCQLQKLHHYSMLLHLKAILLMQLTRHDTNRCAYTNTYTYIYMYM